MHSVLGNYLVWSAAQTLTPTLSKPIRDASKILRKALIGSEGSETPWRYCVSDTNNVMGFALGAMFVRSVFRGRSKELAQVMIQEVKDAFKENLPHLKWMDAETRILAKEKVCSHFLTPQFLLQMFSSSSLIDILFCSSGGCHHRHDRIPGLHPGS